MLAFPIVDAHVHFWDPRRLHYPWLAGIPQLNRPMLPADYTEACGPVKVDGMYFMQAECLPAQAMDEVQFVTDLARQDKRIHGIVAYAPLERGDKARGALELLARNKLVLGVRRMIKSEPDLDFCLRPDFIAGVRALGGFGFSFALGINYKHLRNARKLAEACPDVQFVVDHFAQPDIRGGKLDPWRDDMRHLAELPHVWCKLSSIATEADHKHWKVDDIRPYVEQVIACWGWDRTMFATDWPVSTQAATIPRSVEATLALLPGSHDLQKLFRENALRFYAARPS